MEDDGHLQAGPSVSGKHGPKYTQRTRGTGERRGSQWRNPSGPSITSTNPNAYRGYRPSSTTRQIPNQNYPQRFQNPRRGQLAGRGASTSTTYDVTKIGFDEQTFTETNRHFKSYNYKSIGLKELEEIANSDENFIIGCLNSRREAFLDIIGKYIVMQDVFVLTIKILSKICTSSFDQLKFKLILDMCNTQFIESLLKYLLNLPYAEMKLKNALYWNNQEEFWNNLMTFCDYIITSSPSTAFMKYRSLVDATKFCLNNLNDQNAFPSAKVYMRKSDELQAKLATVSDKHTATMNQTDGSDGTHDVQPPDNFRWLNIVPMRLDLSQHTPFVRPNIIKGAYQDIEHYLDVQFRLLREDCFGPLRDSVIQFKEDPHKRTYDSIRVFKNVKFIQPYIAQGKFGSLVQIENINKKFAKTNWEYNKRFIFGSLILFTKDNCKSFVTATVLDRDPRLLAQGKIPVCLIDERFDQTLYSSNDSYTMIESEIYFEPYYHVMKALQDPLFSQKLPMQQYIVKAQLEQKTPSYLRRDQMFTFDVLFNTNNRSNHQNKVKQKLLYDDLDDNDNDDCDDVDNIFQPTVDKYDVLRPDTWPSKEEFNLDKSQYEAYKHALTHEFAVIQGPPGTGKTFIGLKITKTLLDNLKNINGCLMLVICYTNHALDQFLEGILKWNPSVARIGGQSKNKDLEEINLNLLRSRTSRRSAAHDLYTQQKNNVDMSTNEFKHGLNLIDTLNNGVLSYDSIKDHVAGLHLLGAYYGYTNGDPLLLWLFENRSQFILNFEDCLSKHDENGNMEAVKEDANKKRQKSLVDNDDSNSEKLIETFESEKVKTSFCLKLAEPALKQLITRYKNEPLDDAQRHYLRMLIVDCNSQIMMYKNMSKFKSRRIKISIDQHTNFRNIPTTDRWALYFGWAEPKIETIKNNLNRLQSSLKSKIKTLEEVKMLLDLEILRNTRVVGMTTTAAARLRKLINSLDAPIVIIEEAAEVLEQHIITSLTKNCQHLILIGDHQQLRPSASYIKLARQFNLEVSLFERMVCNGVHSRRLGVQHRMRPEIAALVSPHIYPDLHNHASVLTKSNVTGLDKNLFFFTHDYKEEDSTEWSITKTNHKEAQLTLALANYIMMQGYKPEDVTILTTYSGQMFYMKKERAKYYQLKHVKITVVDNYQGEESRIILLSLVRNNEKGEIGFLGTENRICVALSRAQEGFYIFGNIDILRTKSPLWEKIATTLENYGSLGSSLVLKCKQHINRTVIKMVEDFEKVPPGGCNQQCNLEMKCGHKCLLFCHGYDRPHESTYTRCLVKCERNICDLEHGCPLKCWQECEPCKVLVKKTLPCKHEMDVYCHLDPEDKSIKCLTEVPCTLPACGHKGTKICFDKLEEVICKERCIYRLKCGHACTLTCHVNDDPDHEKYQCGKLCERPRKGCSTVRDTDTDFGKHACGRLCHEPCDECVIQVEKKRSNCKHVYKVACSVDVDAISCQRKCARSMSCGHACMKKCFEPCGGCTEMVPKIISECRHVVKIMCKDAVTRDLCTRKCEKTLTCGHVCKSQCSKICDPNTCIEPSEQQMRASCGHLVSIPCNLVKRINQGAMSAEVLLEHCTQACGVMLACGHVCRGSCATCFQGRLHVPCQNPCGRPIICGHECTEPCNQVCPPCQRPCEVKCAHSTCSKRCGQPCTPCKEKCTRSCPHGTCNRRCHQECEVPPCDQPCDQLLPCGHPCRGLCGEPCPDACKLCRPESFPRGLIGEEFDDDDRLIQLLDCGHILCVDDADGLMNTDREVIHIRTCPHCRKPIINTNRYKDIVNNSFKTEIGPIKKKIYGHVKDIIEKREKLLREFNDAKLPDKVKTNNCLKNKYLKLHEVMGQKKQASLLELEMQLIYLNILSLTANCFEKYTKEKSTELKNEVETQIKLICTVLDTKRKKWLAVTKISEQQQTDALKEIKRLNSIIQFSLFLSHKSYKAVRQNPEVNKAVKEARAVVFSVHAFNEKKTVETLKNLQQIVKVSGCLSMDEIRMVIKAVKDVPQTGHWFKCPNGHFYAIGECGGAMQTSKCVDCGATVGGSRHTLLSTNTHAREIDGSRFPKWSQQYNNMANFNFN